MAQQPNKDRTTTPPKGKKKDPNNDTELLTRSLKAIEVLRYILGVKSFPLGEKVAREIIKDLIIRLS